MWVIPNEDHLCHLFVSWRGQPRARKNWNCLCWIRFPSKLSCGYHSRTCQILRLYGEQSCLVWHMCQCPFSPFLLASANNVNGFELVKIGNCQRPDIPYNLNNQWQPHQQLYPLEHSEPQKSSMSNSVSSKPGLVWNRYFACLNFSSSNDLKWIQTPHRLLRNLWADKTFTTCWSDCRVQVWVQVSGPCRSSDNHSWRLVQEAIEGLTANWWPSALGSAPVQLWLVRLASTNTHGVFLSQQQSLLAAKGLFWEKMLPLLTVSCDLVWKSKGFNALQILGCDSDHSFHGKQNFAITCYIHEQLSLFGSIFQPLVCLWIKQEGEGINQHFLIEPCAKQQM